MPVRQHALLTTVGWIVLATTLLAAVTVVAQFGVWWGIAVIAVGLPCLRLFHDPWRPGAPQPQSLLAPCDGRIIGLETRILDGREDHVVTVSSSWLGTSTLRAPFEGVIGESGGRRGFSMTSDEGDVLTVHFPSRSILGQPRSYIEYGEKVAQGQRIAGLRGVSSVQLVLPAGARPTVELGEKVLAGHTPVAHLEHG